MAETLFKDEGLTSHSAARQALDYLQQIPDDAPAAAEARTREGIIRLFLEHKPGRAEEALRRAIELDAGLLEPRYMLYKLMDLTGRSNHAESVFWEMYELTPEPEKPGRLREWYMSQFYPLTANPTLDHAMGFLGENEEPTMDTERLRFTDFRNSELDRPIGHALAARWCDVGGDPKTSYDLLVEAEKYLSDKQLVDPFFLATKISTLLNLGMFQEAEACLAVWPEPREGYEFWKWTAVVLDEVRGDHAAAVEAYDRMLGIWPGPADWRTRFRKAACLAAMGKHEQAEQERAQATSIAQLMDNQRQQAIREALGNLDDSRSLLLVAEFYRDLGRPREAASWLQLARRAELLGTQSPPVDNGN
jgi:tetratricopeptide (TPR) repeat protein